MITQPSKRLPLQLGFSGQQGGRNLLALTIMVLNGYRGRFRPLGEVPGRSEAGREHPGRYTVFLAAA